MAQRSSAHALPSAAAEALALGARLYQAGKPGEGLRHFERALKLQPNNPTLLWHVGKLLRQLKRPADAVPLLKRAVALRPNTAEPLLDLGLACVDTFQANDGVAYLQRAVELKPDWIDGWSTLGYAQTKARRPEEAEATLRHALTLQPDHAETYNRLGLALSAQGQPAGGEACHRRALELSPESLAAWSNLGGALEAQNKMPEAIAAYERALALSPKNSTIKYNLGIAQLTHGQLRRDVWLKYEYRWVVLRESPQRDFTQPIWRGEPLEGKSILIYAEQGLGDTLQFVRYAGVLAARGATVHVEVQPPLKALLGSMPGATSVLAKGDPLPAFDFHCPLLSLPFALDTRLDTIPDGTPYVQAPEDRIGKWSETLGPARRLRIGVVWRGNPRHTNDANRSMPLETFQAIFASDIADFFSLQIRPSAAESAILGAHANCRDLTAAIADFGDTAALIAQLDLVIAVDTSVAHLAGAMGKPVWLLLPFAPDWRWMLDRADTPWYPQMRLFRQPAVRDWNRVVAEVARALALAVPASVAA